MDILRDKDKIYNAPGQPSQGLTATGGVISDYSDSGTIYRSHVFTSSGTFVVSALSNPNFTDTVEYLVIGGGGGGGVGGTTRLPAGGGGAGGFRTKLLAELVVEDPLSAFPVSIGSYTSCSWFWWCWWCCSRSKGGNGTRGGNSVFDDFLHPISSTGGGGGGVVE